MASISRSSRLGPSSRLAVKRWRRSPEPVRAGRSDGRVGDDRVGARREVPGAGRDGRARGRVAAHRRRGRARPASSQCTSRRATGDGRAARGGPGRRPAARGPTGRSNPSSSLRSGGPSRKRTRSATSVDGRLGPLGHPEHVVRVVEAAQRVEHPDDVVRVGHDPRRVLRGDHPVEAADVEAGEGAVALEQLGQRGLAHRELHQLGLVGRQLVDRARQAGPRPLGAATGGGHRAGSDDADLHRRIIPEPVRDRHGAGRRPASW